jgi:alanine racemase
MDQFMVDVSDISDVEVMDLVTLIGKDHDQEITLEDLGELSGRFNYEFACDLGMRIPRLYYKDGKLVDIKGYHSFDQM